MSQLFTFLQYLFSDREDDRGATMVEYGLLVVLIALVVAVGATALGTAGSGVFTDVANRL